MQFLFLFQNLIQIWTKSSLNRVSNTLFNSNKNEQILVSFPKINFTTFKILLFPLFLFFCFKAYFQIHFQRQFKPFWTLIKTTQPNKSNAPACMLNHVATPYDEFYYSEKYHFSYISWAQNTKLNQFIPFSKRANFRVLQTASVVHDLPGPLIRGGWVAHLH